jgi:hypothetical protein
MMSVVFHVSWQRAATEFLLRVSWTLASIFKGGQQRRVHKKKYLFLGLIALQTIWRNRNEGELCPKNTIELPGVLFSPEQFGNWVFSSIVLFGYSDRT